MLFIIWLEPRHDQIVLQKKFITSICVYIALLIVWSGPEPQVCSRIAGGKATNVGKSPIVPQFTARAKTSTKPTGFDLIKIL